MGSTITHAARTFGISQGHLSNIVLGRRRPGPDLALTISKKTKTKLEIWLFKTKKNLNARKKAIKSISIV